MILTTLKLLGTRTGKGFAILVLAGLGITAGAITPAQALDLAVVNTETFNESVPPSEVISDISFTNPNDGTLNASLSFFPDGNISTSISGNIIVSDPNLDPNLPNSPISVSVSAESSSSTISTSSSSTISTAAASVPFEIPGGPTIPIIGSVISLGVIRRIRKFASQKIFTTN